MEEKWNLSLRQLKHLNLFKGFDFVFFIILLIPSKSEVFSWGSKAPNGYIEVLQGM